MKSGGGGGGGVGLDFHRQNCGARSSLDIDKILVSPSEDLAKSGYTHT